jgi:hypothetical protein
MESWFWRFPVEGFQDIQLQKLDEAVSSHIAFAM